MEIGVNNISKRYGDQHIYKNFSLPIEEGCITTILGPSGVGKSTLLRMIAGLESPDSGTILLPQGRKSMLFQDPILLPWYSVERNIALPLENILPTNQIAARVNHILEAVELTECRKSAPSELSGGMRQRVSMARAFASPGELLLLDEPFQSLDIRLRVRMGELFLRLWKELPRTTLMVTHDIQEALSLSHRVIVLRGASAKKVLDIDVPGAVGERELSAPMYSNLFRRIYTTLLEE